jgi:hypothetical protein
MGRCSDQRPCRIVESLYERVLKSDPVVMVWYGARYVKYRGPEVLRYVISERRVWRHVLGRFGMIKAGRVKLERPSHFSMVIAEPLTSKSDPNSKSGLSV